MKIDFGQGVGEEIFKPSWIKLWPTLNKWMHMSMGIEAVISKVLTITWVETMIPKKSQRHPNLTFAPADTFRKQDLC